jgi:acyl-CoA thioester hydrolase
MPAMPEPRELTPSARPLLEGAVRVRARYSECDPMGFVHHAVYPVWMEMARTELLRVSGVSYRDMEDADILLVIVKLECRYKRPARYDDDLLVSAKVIGGGRAKLVHAYEVRKVASDGNSPGELLVEAETTLGCIGRDGRPRPLPDWLMWGGSGKDAIAK